MRKTMLVGNPHPMKTFPRQDIETNGAFQ